MDIISPPVKSEDPENLKSSSPRCRFLDYCLVISLVLLTMVVGSLCTLYLAWERPLLASIINDQIQNYQTMKNAQLVVDNRMLINGTLEWSKNRVKNTFVGQYIKHDKEEFVVQESGFYLIYSQLTLKCVQPDHCKEEGVVTLSVLKNIKKESLLNITVHISKSSMKSQPSSSSGIARYLSAGDRIGAELQTSSKMEDWNFDRENTVFGLLYMSSMPTVDSDK